MIDILKLKEQLNKIINDNYEIKIHISSNDNKYNIHFVVKCKIKKNVIMILNFECHNIDKMTLNTVYYKKKTQNLNWYIGYTDEIMIANVIYKFINKLIMAKL